MRIDRWFEVNVKQKESWRAVMEKSLVYTLPNGLQFYNNFNDHSLFLVDKDMVILCRIYADNLDLFIEER